MLISLLVSIVVYLLLNSRFSAIRMASQLLEQFAESETRYKSLFELSPEAVIIHRQGQVLLVNKAAQHLLGAESPGLLIARNVLDFVHPDSKAEVLARMKESSDKPLPFTEEKLVRLDGTDFLAEVTSAAIHFEGKPATQVLFRDISSEQAARYEAQISRAVFKHTHEPMMVTDAKGQIILVNAAFTQVTGYESLDVQHENASILSSGYHDESFYLAMWDELKAEGQWEGEITNRRKNGEIYIQRAHMSAIKGFQNQVTHYICVMSDITEQKRELESIRFQALHDPLTHLPNRILFISEVKKAISSAKNNKQQCAVLFIDLDGFKPVNDNYGHLVGDKLLKALAKKLSGAVKHDDMVSRVGGDEFLVLLRNIDDEHGAMTVAERLIALVKEPLLIDGISLHLGASIGGAIYPDHALNELELIDLADQAMYQVKRTDKGRAHLCTPVNRANTIITE
ncbi:diguanylate cyclase domain-containing protein [Oceanospirillum multiglobuliferum]|uniref:diguanylate cyclase domain-containing protein n=1 Tax=Oceanospirillum multiglobuliferum TaxID=64969 RepID=UPI0009996616|nr:diguanylate cyclase [Oceanospirillum multiglobuliferum]